MDFTSSYSSGYKLNETKFNIPVVDNLYGVIYTTLFKKEIAIYYFGLGWSIRKSGFESFEFQSEWSEFDMDGKDDVLVRGICDLNQFDELIESLKRFKLDFKFEIYDNTFQLVKTVEESNSN